MTVLDHYLCSACGLVCDDLQLEGSTLTRSSAASNCKRAAAFLDRATSEIAREIGPTVDGRKSDWPTALAAASRALSEAVEITVQGLDADARSMRAMLAACERWNGLLIPAWLDADGDTSAVRQSGGWIGTTYSEVRKRADLIVVWGEQLWIDQPRLAERMLSGFRSRQNAGTSRQLVTISAAAEAPANVRNELTRLSGDARHLQVENGQLSAFVGALRCQLAGRRGGSLSPEWMALAKQLERAAYTVIAWEPGELARSAGLPAAIQLAGLAVDCQLTRRAAVLICGARAGQQTAAQVAQWTTGVSLPLAYCPEGPEHIGLNRSMTTARSQASATVWLQTIGEPIEPPVTNGARVVIAPYCPTTRNNGLDIHLPCAQPGVDDTGIVCRGDGSASLMLRRFRSSDRQPASWVINTLSSMIPVRAADEKPPESPGSKDR